MKLTKDKATGYWKARIWTEHGPRTLSTKVSDHEQAKAIVSQSGLKQAELAARAGHLTAAAISKILTGRKINIEYAVAEWLQWLGSIGRSGRTVHNYRLFLNSFVTAHPVLMPATITETHVNQWLNHPDLDEKAGSRLVRLTAIRSFFEFCNAKGWCSGNPARLVAVNFNQMTHTQKEPRRRLPFTDREVDILLAHTDPDQPATTHPQPASTMQFWHLAILFGRHLGLRLGDIACLERPSFAKAGRIIVWTDKHDARVELPLKPKALADAIAALPKRHKLYLFPEQRALAVDLTLRATLSTQFSRLCQKAGITGKSFHCLRHTYATDCKRQGKPLWYIRQSMGHSRSEATLNYIH